MNNVAKLALCLCLALMIAAPSRSAAAATIDQRIMARLDALERENSVLRARLNRLEAAKAADAGKTTETSKAIKSARRQARDAFTPAQQALAADRPIVARKAYAPRFEISGSLDYLQPGAGNLEYGTLITPLPVVSPSWENQALKPEFRPAFSVGARYIADETTDIAVNWTHHKTSADASVFASPTQMVGPPFLIGPESALYKNGYGSVDFSYDAVNLDIGHTFCADCAFQLRAFGGVEYARIGQDLTGTFANPSGAESMSSTTHSLFTGIGPRLGVKGQYNVGAMQFIGEVAGAALIGTEQAHMNFTTVAPTLTGPTIQSLTSPDSTRVIPSIDARLAAAYAFAPSAYGQFKLELGYRAAVYFDAINEYSITQVPTSLMLPPTGVYLATVDQLHSNFTDQGPYLTARWLFGQRD